MRVVHVMRAVNVMHLTHVMHFAHALHGTHDMACMSFLGILFHYEANLTLEDPPLTPPLGCSQKRLTT